MVTQLVKLPGRSGATSSPSVGPNQGDDLVWRRLRASLGGGGVLAFLATLAMIWWAVKAGGQATLTKAWPLAVAALGIVYSSGVVHGRRVILFTFLLGYIMIPLSLVGEPTVWRVAGYALFTGGQAWNLIALRRATPLPTSKVLPPRKG